ncbi:hypothetical protein DSO57_1017863 [Entomophthora muscae]|uniref:Uncharacterized protein n=1 Tax=Entomophthora muscae TaxID=34485 RepID=A0ACC2SU16_9FUNG|nr:hypothetical protein DSO57_1017863 [Entomophthora muscae]
MGLYISKLSFQALIISQIAMHCSAAPTTTHDNLSPADTKVLLGDIGLNGIEASTFHSRNPMSSSQDTAH